jgi:hypothetical protein
VLVVLVGLASRRHVQVESSGVILSRVGKVIKCFTLSIYVVGNFRTYFNANI